MRVLIVKLSSLGDVVHTLPVVHDIRHALPQAQIDWLVEPAFAGLVRRVDGVGTVIEAPLRALRGSWWSPATWKALGAVRSKLTAAPYDAVIDLQGLTKSAVLARLATLAPGGHRYGLGNRTEGSGWEAPARWLVDRPVTIEPRIHALDRGRELCAQALGYTNFGRPEVALRTRPVVPPMAPMVAFVHGTSREDKLWPQQNWIALGKRVLAQGWGIALPQSGEAEQTRAELIAAALQFELAPLVQVWPTLKLDGVIDRLAGVQGVIGVDSGLSHIAVALGLPHVQIYNHPTAWRTGPLPGHGHRQQLSVEGARGAPTLDAVWSAWQEVAPSQRTVPY